MKTSLPFRGSLEVLAIVTVIGASGRAQADDHTFEVEAFQRKVCGTYFTHVRVRVTNPKDTVLYQEFPDISGDFNRGPNLPYGIRVGGAAPLSRVNRSTSTPSTISISPEAPLFMEDQALTLNEEDRKRDCIRIRAHQEEWEHATENEPMNIDTGLLSIQIQGRTAEVEIRDFVLAVAPIATPISSQPPNAQPLNHLILYTPENVTAAVRLSQLRNSQNISSVAISLDTIPGQNPGDPIPSECLGAFLAECYHLSTHSLPDFISKEAVPSLIGMVNRIPAGQDWTRVPDLAGLVRAYIRSLKRAHSELRYILFMGDPLKLPIRYTNWKSVFFWERPWSMQELTPTDLYFEEVFGVWSFAGIQSAAQAIGMGWPPRPIVFDTTKFRWPLHYGMARNFALPNPFLQTDEDAARVMSVGRMHGKPNRIPAVEPDTEDIMPLGGRDDIMTLVTKLEQWAGNMGAAEIAYVASADGVYEKDHLMQFEDRIGRPFDYSGEGFKTGYDIPLAYQTSPQCTSCRPTANDWHTIPHGCMNSYQNRYLYCSKPDPSVQYNTWQPVFPNPRETLVGAGQTGYGIFLMTGHGSPDIMGHVTEHSDYGPENSQRPRRLFSVPLMGAVNDPEDSKHDLTPLNRLAWAPGKMGGMVLSEACSVASFIVGGYGFAEGHSLRTIAEEMPATPNGGSLATYMNYHEGFYQSDPPVQIQFLSRWSELRNNPPLSRPVVWGDVIAQHIRTAARPNPSWQVLNRFLIGDPATGIGRITDPEVK